MSLYEWICWCECMPNGVLPKSVRENVEEEESMDIVDMGDSCVDDTNCSRLTMPSCMGSMDDFIVNNEGSDVMQVEDPLNCPPCVLPDTQTTLVDNYPSSEVSSPHAPKIIRGKKTRIVWYIFLPDHPLVETHHIALQPESDCYVPNFVSGLLPRRDVGDREFYCSMMLTLFKPWRSSTDWKSVDQSWSDLFEQQQFILWQNNIMNNFNL